MNNHVVIFICTLAATSSALHSAIPPSCIASIASQEDASKLAKVTESFEALKAALAELPPILNDALEASVQEEELQRKKSDERGGNTWRCEDALRRAKDRSVDRRKAAGALVQRAENKWAAAKGAARGIDPASLPWGATSEEAKQVNDAILRMRKLYNDVNSAQSSIGPKRIASIWKEAQDYAGKQPKVLPPAKAEEIVPARITIPCLETSVAMRP